MHFGRKGACSGVPVAPVSSVPAAPPASAANIMSVIGRREQERRYLVARENRRRWAEDALPTVTYLMNETALTRFAGVDVPTYLDRTPI